MRKLPYIFATLVLFSATVDAAYVPKRSHIQTAALTYQVWIPYSGDNGTGDVMYSKLGYYDMLINPGGKVKTTFRTLNPHGAVINYGLQSTYYPSGQSGITGDTAWLVAWANSKGFDINNFFLTATEQVTVGYSGNPVVQTNANLWTKLFDYNTYRYMPDLRNPDYWQLFWERFKRSTGSDEGTMEDEGLCLRNAYDGNTISSAPMFPFNTITQGSFASWGWAGTQAQIIDSIIKLNALWWPRISDSLYANNKFYFRNWAAYTYLLDSTGDFTGNPARYSPVDMENTNYIGHKNINMLLGEYCNLNCSYDSRSWQYLMYTQRLVDSGARVILWTNPWYTNGTDGDIGVYGKERAYRARLCYYYMAAHPTLTWWSCNNNSGTTTLFAFDTILQRGITEYNVGVPTGHLSKINNSKSYLKRVYTNAVILWNQKGSGAHTYDLSQDTSTFHCSAFQEVTDAGTLSGTSVLSVNLLDMDGKIMIPMGGTAFTGSLSIGDASVTEGGNLIFTVTLSAVQATTVSFNWATVVGSALPGSSCSAGTDYLSVSGTKTIIAGQTTTTITVPTCNDAVYEPTETMSVALSNLSPSTIYFLDASGTGTILDNDEPSAPNPPQNKIIKGKVQITGKVKIGG